MTSDTITQLMESNLLRVFNERNTDRRLAAIGDTYSPQVRWTDLFTVITASP
jgi:hypothetical protein